MTTNSIGGADQLRPGTIVSFRFPLGEGEGFAKSRPCLVIAASQGADGEPRVTIAYGTSAVTRSNRGLDLDLSDPQDWAAAGLRRPSRFVLMRRVTVALSDYSLDRGKTGSPVIGVLPPSAMVTLRQMTRFLGATITEDRPRGAPPAKEGNHRARTSRRSRQNKTRPVVVEYRRRKRISKGAPAMPPQRRMRDAGRQAG